MHVKRTTLACCVLLGTVAGAAAAADAATVRTGGTRVSKPSGHAAIRARLAAPHGAARAWHAHRTAALQRHARGPAVASAGGGISCVPYARSITGMAVRGNGGDWWANAAGSYDRGQQPEPGSVMAFRATASMTHGHVAVVSRVMSPREVLIDHANWGGPGIRRGSIMHNVSVIDVSDANDWTAVRVQVGHDSNSFGRVYPTYGFIYNHPEGETGTAYASGPMRRGLRLEQVAELPMRAEPVAFQRQGMSPLTKTAPQRQR